MLPKSLFSTYSQYKTDTSAFVTWLGNVAEACGYKPNKEKKLSETDRSEAPKSANLKPEESAKGVNGRLKGKARIEAKKLAQAKVNDDSFPSAESFRTVKYALSSQEMLAQVDAVAASKSQIKMPSGIQKILERAIDARRRCSAWYEATKNSQFDDDGHDFFIQMLQDALSKLKRDPGQEETRMRNGAAKNASSKDKTLADLENRFALLEVEDADEFFQLSPTEVALTSATRPTKKQKLDSVDVFELEADRAFDKAFAVFCFFEDLHRIQKQLQQLWKNCNAGQINPVTATVTTHAAISMVQKAEQELLSSEFEGLPADKSYKALAGTVIMLQKLTKGMKASQGNQVDVTPFDEFTFLPAARILFKFSEVAAMSNNFEAQWPAPIFSYVFLGADKMELHEFKKLHHDDEILTQLLLDLQLPDKCVKHGPKGESDFVKLPQEDIFLRTMRPVWTKGQVTVTAAFTAQIMLNILDASNDPSLFYKHLHFCRHHATESFDVEIRNGGQVFATRGLNWPDSGAKHLSGSYRFLKDLEVPKTPMMRALFMQCNTTPKMYTWANSTPEQRAFLGSRFGAPDLQRPPPEMEAAMESMNMKFIKPAPDYDFLLNNNPLFSGTVMLKILVDYHEAGLSLTNHHMSIYIAAHLYNALRQLNMLGEDWPIMEKIMALHKRALFVDEVPTRTSDIADRLTYRLNFERNQRRHFEDGKYKFKEPETVQIFRELLDTTERNDRIVWQVEQQIQSLENTNGPSPAAVKAKAKDAKSGARRAQQLLQLTPEAYVSGAQTAFSRALSDLSIDYIRLTKSCIVLLDTFRDSWNQYMRNEGMDIQHGALMDGTSSRDMSRLTVCHEAFGEAKAVREMGIYTYAPGDGDVRGVRGSMNDDPNDEKRHGMGLLVASQVMKEFLAKKEDFKFPLYVDREVLARVETPKTAEHLKNVTSGIKQLSTPSEFQSFLSRNTYVVVNFYTDYAKTKGEMATCFADEAKKHGVSGILEFVRVNKDDMRDLAAQYCATTRGGQEQNFVFFKEGKQVAVNGTKVLRGADKVGLKAASQKLGGLAKKREAEMRG